MTDASDLPPAQEAVRRQLADARHVGPPPPEVVARLDDTLAALVAERGAPASGAVPGTAPDAPAPAASAPAVDLAARRRRITGVGLLAAASVVVAGVALGQVLPRGAGDEGGSSASSDSSLAEAPADSGGGSEPESGDAGTDRGEVAPESLRRSPPATTFAGRPALTSTDPDLDQQVLALRPDAAREGDLDSLDALSGCALPSPGPGRRLLAQVDGAAGVVVYRRPAGATQQAEVFVCGASDPVRTLTLPAP
ncbi:hypothetical protein GCM10011376_05630 [Nocardioides flavus (ex Wang et al. 2016)]|uniref:Uncharacterized protein n=1 Tax=Nocardioides flavus (ex Wang et al. 2016) TaxID=2058780 RepID=A0ABQ3HEE3_9ACTN|nr:hypothetical protein [Nocardioides flavus (ex Wang et al. 2016)]GHE15783.1 hypothetical protein GCM10011376_05630 [Nocardioides flavus (ex Wang et al. 2016)]